MGLWIRIAPGGPVMSGEVQPMDAYWVWLDETLNRDQAERRGPVLVGEWDERATAAGWPADGEVPV